MLLTCWEQSPWAHQVSLLLFSSTHCPGQRTWQLRSLQTQRHALHKAAAADRWHHELQDSCIIDHTYLCPNTEKYQLYVSSCKARHVRLYHLSIFWLAAVLTATTGPEHNVVCKMMDHITCMRRQHCQNEAEESNQRQLPLLHDEL